MSSSQPDAPTALIYSGKTPEGFLVFDRQVKRWLRRRCKGLTKYFWEGEAPIINADTYAALCQEIYTSLLKTSIQDSRCTSIRTCCVQCERTVRQEPIESHTND